MAEKIFDKQINFGWGLTFNMTGKAPAIAKRIFNTLADAEEYANDFNDSAVEGLLLSVIADDNKQNNGVYFVQSIKQNAEGDNATLVKIASEEIEELIKLINNTKDTIDTYTINEKLISENPVLNTDDLVISDNYSLLNQTGGNVAPGDVITDALSKVEIMLANTTLALTAALNDLESKVFGFNVSSLFVENGTINNITLNELSHKSLYMKPTNDSLVDFAVKFIPVCVGDYTSGTNSDYAFLQIEYYLPTEINETQMIEVPTLERRTVCIKQTDEKTITCMSIKIEQI